MEYRFEFDARALAEAEYFREWIAQRSPEGADKWYQGLFQEIESLKTFPRRCPIAPESQALGVEIRELLYGKSREVYRVLYVVRDDLVRILSVRHSSRRPADS